MIFIKCGKCVAFYGPAVKETEIGDCRFSSVGFAGNPLTNGRIGIYPIVRANAFGCYAGTLATKKETSGKKVKSTRQKRAATKSISKTRIDKYLKE